MLERHEAGSAIPLLIEAAAWDDLGRAIVAALGAAHPPVPHEAHAQWYARLPDEFRLSPSGRLLAAVVAAEGNPDCAWDRFQDCAKAFRAAGDAAGEVACLAQLARLCWWSEEPARLAGLAVRVLELEAEGCEEAVALACIGRALLFDVQNDSRQVLAALDEVPPGSLSGAWQGVVSWLRAVACLQLGDTERALKHAEDALARDGGLHVLLAEGTRVQALWFQGRIAEATAAMPGVLRGLRDAGYRTHTALAAAQCAVAYALQGDHSRAAECLAQARVEVVDPDAPLVDTNLSLAAAAMAVMDGNEASAAATLTRCLERHPLGEGLSAGAHLRNLALIYVLVPATRSEWDRAELGPAFLVARDLARALLTVRDCQRLSAAAAPLPDPAMVRAHLPLRWTAELALAAVAVGRDDGWSLLDQTWPAIRPVVMDVANGAPGLLRRAAGVVLNRLPVPPTVPLELRLLGPVELRRDGLLVDAAEWRRERVRSLLAYLTLHGAVSRARLAEEFWPQLDPEAQSKNLRVTLTYLLKVLEPDRGPRQPSFFIRQHGGHLSLHPGDWLTVDIWEFDTLCEQAADADRRESPTETLDYALRALELWRGDPAELTEPWGVVLSEQRQRRFTAIATRAGELLLTRGDTDKALALADHVLTTDPWLDAAHRLTIAAHRANQDHLAAQRALARYQQAIHDLGLSSTQASTMVQRLLDTIE